MTSESATSPAIPPPQEQHSDHQQLPQNPVYSDPISAVHPSPPKVSMEFIVNSNRVLAETIIYEIEEPSYYKYLDKKEYANKFRRYESDFMQYLMSRYFSGKDPNGVDIYEKTIIIDGHTIKLSKWPCTHFFEDPDSSYVEPAQCIVEDEEEDDDEEEEEEEEEDEESVDSATEEITTGEISNGGTVSEKNSS